MACGYLILRRVEVGLVCQTVICPYAGGLIILVCSSHGRVYENPSSVYIGLNPPVIAYIYLVLGAPVV